MDKAVDDLPLRWHLGLTVSRCSLLLATTLWLGSLFLLFSILFFRNILRLFSFNSSLLTTSLLWLGSLLIVALFLILNLLGRSASLFRWGRCCILILLRIRLFLEGSATLLWCWSGNIICIVNGFGFSLGCSTLLLGLLFGIVIIVGAIIMLGILCGRLLLWSALLDAAFTRPIQLNVLGKSVTVKGITIRRATIHFMPKSDGLHSGSRMRPLAFCEDVGAGSQKESWTYTLPVVIMHVTVLQSILYLLLILYG